MNSSSGKSSDTARGSQGDRPGTHEDGSTTRRGLVENEIFAHAARLFAERGFAGTSLQDIAEAMGMTRPALYYYVKNKEDLLSRLVAEITQAPATQLAQIAEAPEDAATRLRRMVHLTAARAATDSVGFRLLLRSESELPDELQAVHEAGRREVLRSVATVIAEGSRSGQFRPVDARVSALALIGMSNWVAWWFDPDGALEPDTVAAHIADMAVTSLQREDGRVPESQGPLAALAMLREDLDHLEQLLTE